jgi:hypothetical protein
VGAFAFGRARGEAGHETREGAGLCLTGVSIALQFGADLETIRAALTRNHDGGPGNGAGHGLGCDCKGGAMTLHLGIDIGVQGAIAIIDQSGALVEIHVSIPKTPSI